jgi:ubiquinone/menaquinone biosynthesis C-methylase UbiE
MRASSLQQPFAAETFDQIVATFPSPYIFSPQALTEINRTLRPGGELLIIPTAWSTSQSIVQRLFSWLLNISVKTNDETEKNQARMKNLFKKHGFDVSFREHEIKKSKVLLITAIKIR